MATLTREERKEIAREAEAMAERLADEPLSPLDELLAMSREELDAYFKDHGVEIDWERLEDEVALALGPDVLALDRGADFSEDRFARLEGNAKKAVVTAAKATANKTMGDARMTAMFEGDERPDDEKAAMWVSVGSGCCPDCHSLHGEVLSLDFWRGHEPRDGQTLCGHRCRCSLVPVAVPDEDRGLRVEEARAGLEPRR